MSTYLESIARSHELLERALNRSQIDDWICPECNSRANEHEPECNYGVWPTPEDDNREWEGGDE